MEFHKPPFKLKEIKLEVTHACGLRCLHCSSMAHDKNISQMSGDDCTRILKEAVEMGATEVAFSGGEPLLWKHLLDSVSIASDNGMDVLLYTTGNVPNASAMFERLKASEITRVMFSLFGADKERHEAVTMVQGSFDGTLAAVKACISLGIDTEFHFVPMADNYKYLPQITALGGELGVKRISVLRLVPQGRGAVNADKQLNRKQNLALRKSITDLRKKDYDIRTGSPYNFLMLRDKPKCCSGIDRITVSPDLKLSPCDAFKQISAEQLRVSDEFTNLKGRLLHECWERSPYLNKIRKYLTTPFSERCSACKALEKCLSGCMAQKFYTHGALEKSSDPMCLLR